MPPNAVLQRLSDEREAERRAIDQITEAAEADERDLTDTDRQVIERHQARVAELEPQIELLTTEAERRATSKDARAFLTRAGEAEAPAKAAGEGEVVYRSFAQYARDVLITQVPQIAAAAGPGSADRASERLERLERAVAHTLVADVPGLMPPQHLAQIIDVINRSRPVVEATRSTGLTSGKMTYPKITQRPQVGKQAAEKTELVSRKMTVAMQDILAEVYGGSGNLSWQAINWTTPDALSLFMDLLAEAYAQETEKAAAAALVAGVTQAVTGIDYSAATPQQWYAALAAAAGAVYGTSRRGANTVFADVATAFMLAPAFAAQAPMFLPGGQISLQSGAGSVAGLRLVPSYGFAAATVIVGDASAFLTAETPGAPVELRAVEPAIGGLEVGIIGAFASEVLEPNAFAKVPDTGIARSGGSATTASK